MDNFFARISRSHLGAQEIEKDVPYNHGFKARMVQRLAGPERISANALAADVGVSQSTLSRWLRESSSVEVMSSSKKNEASTTGPSPSPRKRWSAEEKLRAVSETNQLPDEELGSFLRREGIHEAQLREWQAAALAALSPSTSKKKKGKVSPQQKRVRELEKELHRKEKALAEAAALLVLKKKVQEIWGDEDENMDTKKGI